MCDLGRLEHAGLVTAVRNRFDAGLHFDGLHGGRCGPVQNLQKFVLASLGRLGLGDRRLDPLGLGQQLVVLGLPGLCLRHLRPLALFHGLFIAVHRRFDRLLGGILEGSHLGENRSKFVEQFLDAGGHVCGSCMRVA